jgi:hypothetical protein
MVRKSKDDIFNLNDATLTISISKSFLIFTIIVCLIARMLQDLSAFI